MACERAGQLGAIADINKNWTSLKHLEAHALKNGEPKPESGRREFLENLINEFI